MSEPAPDTAHADSHGDVTRAYLVVFGSLAVFTAASFVIYEAEVSWHLISKYTAFALIMGVAVVKASLVGLYFMHLKWDWAKLYFMIVPEFILGTMMMFVLLPDGVVAWHHNEPEAGATQPAGE